MSRILTRESGAIYQKIMAALPAGAKPEDYVASVEVTARKPGGRDCCGPACCDGTGLRQ